MDDNYIPALPKQSKAPQVFEHEEDGVAVKGGTFIRQVTIFDQFLPELLQSVTELDTPQAICGYVAPSVAYTVAERWPKLTMTVDEVNEMVKHLRDYKNVMPTMRNMMDALHKERLAYVESHPDEFTSEAEARLYVRDWVANYEISDYIKAHPNPAINFLRHVDRTACEHEEARRVPEVEPFKDLIGFVESSSGADTASSATSSSTLLRWSEWVERSSVAAAPATTAAATATTDTATTDTATTDTATTDTATDAESTAAGGAAGGAGGGAGAAVDTNSSNDSMALPSPSPVFICDALGHYVVVVPKLVTVTAADGAVSTQPTTLILNSMRGSLTAKVIVNCAHHMCFRGAHEKTEPSLFTHKAHRPDMYAASSSS